MSGPAVRVTVWSEFRQERTDPEVRAIYPDGIHAAIASGLQAPDVEVRTATLDEPEHGLTEAVLAETDVLTWWGHMAHPEVDDAVVDRVQRRVLEGMGLVVLHSGHFSKIFTALLGTTCSLKWRNDGERELVWTVKPSHPIAAGVESPMVIPKQEMYGELFDIPDPDDLIFISSFEGGEVFRSGVTFSRGKGRIFYFSPGDQEYPVYHQPQIRQVIANAVGWVAQPKQFREAPGVSNAPRDWYL